MARVAARATPAIGALLAALFAAAPAGAATGWLAPVPLSQPGRDANNPEVAMAEGGQTAVLWERLGPANTETNLQLSTRSPGGSFSAPTDISLTSAEPQVAMLPNGEAIAAWRHFENPPGVNEIQVATMPPGGSFRSPTSIYVAPPGAIPRELRLAVSPKGVIGVAWTTVDPNSGLDKNLCPPLGVGFPGPCPNPRFVEASVRVPGGAFSEPSRISPPRRPIPPGETAEEKLERELEEARESASEPSISVDDQGDAVVLWTFDEPTGPVVQWAGRNAGSIAFSTPTTISPSGVDSISPSVGFDSARNAIAIWQSEPAGRVVRAAVRPPGGAFSDIGQISPAGVSTSTPVLAVNPAGTATAVWHAASSAGNRLQTATRPPGGVFSGPVAVSTDALPNYPALAMNEAGDAVIVWVGDLKGRQVGYASVRTGLGDFSEPVLIPVDNPPVHPAVAIDAGADATAVWSQGDGTNEIVRAIGYDGDPPQLADVSVPATARVGEALRMSARPVDAWPTGAPAFNFGDGGRATGGEVTHTYGRPGNYQVSISVLDAGGRSVTATRAVLVKARNDLRIDKLVRNRKKGTATLYVQVLEPGVVTATGKGVRTGTARTAQGGTVKVPVRLRGKARKRLSHRGKARTTLSVRYSPDGGDPRVVRYRATLLKKLG